MNPDFTARLEYYQLSGETSRFRRIAGKLKRPLDNALDKLSIKIASNPRLSGFFRDVDHTRGAVSLLRQHWLRLFAEGPTEEYFGRATTIGHVHAKIGLEPKWFVGSYALILGTAVEKAVAPGILSWLPWRRRLAKDVAVMVQASLLDMEIALSTYFEVEEKAREGALARMVSCPFRNVRGAWLNKFSRVSRVLHPFWRRNCQIVVKLAASRTTMRRR